MTITQNLKLSTPAEPLATLVEIRKQAWLNSFSADAERFQPTEDYLKAGMAILRSYRLTVATELEQGAALDNEILPSDYREWQQASQCLASTAEKLAVTLMSMIDLTFHERVSRELVHVPRFITREATELRWWMDAMEDAGWHHCYLAISDNGGFPIPVYQSPFLPEEHARAAIVSRGAEVLGFEATSLPPDVRESLGLLGSAQVEKVLADAKSDVRVRLMASAAQETADAQWSGIWLGGDLERIEDAIDAAVNMLGYAISDDERERVVALLGDKVPF